MREIKFRAWDKQKKEMYYSPDLWWAILKDNETWDDDSGFNIELMQFTGLKDKNGKEIYEGDIIGKDGKADGEIVFRNGHFAVKDELSDKIGDCPIIFVQSPQEVIGNIYENPELLKVSADKV